MFTLPFLLFPTFFPIGTLAAFLLLIGIELLPPLFRWRPLPDPQPFDLLLLFWLLLIGISILVTADPELTLNKASGVFLGIVIWRYLGRAAQRPFPWHLALLFYGLLGGGFIGLGILSADWLAKSGPIAALTALLPNQQINIPGLGDGAAHPNQVAGTLLFYIPLLWSVTIAHWQTHKNWQRIILALLTLMATAVLILTQSRSGWLAGVASLYLLVLLWTAVLPPNHPQRKTLLILSGAFTLLGIIAFFLVGPERIASLWQDPAQETAIGALNSLGFRQELWRWVIVMLQDFPFTGIGLGSLQHVIRRLYPVMIDPGYPLTHAHNVFLQMGVDYGVLGLIVYLALIGILLMMLWRTARQQTRWRPYALGFAATLLAYHIYGLGDVLDSKTNLVIWIMYGLITSLHQLNSKPAEVNPAPASG
ncbi:MAG: O-antigen ligase family protein [Ardenticatenaceae bacterium]|nr:O-antigen ligase family protein [Anaerolineales bacterium]MCB8937678.1 O-antigen ligase family protein [Ardenticatenaceae bacterium]MCB8974247.1 O-antigen ligase family protein [Ardenticatenaceae bacterium]